MKKFICGHVSRFYSRSIQDALVGQFRGESDRKAALDAAKKEIKAQAHRVHLPAHFHGLRERLATEVAHVTDQLIDDIAAQLD